MVRTGSDPREITFNGLGPGDTRVKYTANLYQWMQLGALYEIVVTRCLSAKQKECIRFRIGRSTHLCSGDAPDLVAGHDRLEVSETSFAHGCARTKANGECKAAAAHPSQP